MSDLLLLINQAMKAAEISAAENEDDKDNSANEAENFTDAMTSLITYYEAVIARTNSILDRNKRSVFIDVLNLNTRGEVERAMLSYTTAYLFGLNLSMESTAELAQNLIYCAKKYGLPIPKDWNDVARSNANVGVVKSKLKHVRQTLDI